MEQVIDTSLSRELIIAEARRRGFKVAFIGPTHYFYTITDKNGRTEIMRATRPLRNSAHSYLVCKDKNLTMEYVESLGYEVPPYISIGREQVAEAEKFLHKHSKVVVKPIDGQQSKGITTDVASIPELRRAIEFAMAAAGSDTVVIQKQITGNLYRLLVINGKFIAAGHRKAPQAVGDGKSTVRELVTQLNKDSRRGDGPDNPLKKIDPQHVLNLLGADGFEQVPSKGQVVKLSQIDSVSVGGEASNVTGLVHGDWKKAAIELAKPLDMFICGYDFMCDDISKPIKGKYLPLLEMNNTPGLKLHHFPTGGGEPVNVAAKLLDELFGDDK